VFVQFEVVFWNLLGKPRRTSYKVASLSGPTAQEADFLSIRM